MWYGEPQSDARTPLADFFRILLVRFMALRAKLVIPVHEILLR